MRSDRVGELGVVVDLLDDADHLGRHLLVELHIVLEFVDDRARERLGLHLLAAIVGQHDGVGLVVFGTVSVALNLRACGALDQHLDGTVG